MISLGLRPYKRALELVMWPDDLPLLTLMEIADNTWQVYLYNHSILGHRTRALVVPRRRQ